jgi:predicted protein tyrosine phosphatase
MQLIPWTQIYGETELLECIRRGENCHDHLISIGNPRRLFEQSKPGQFMPVAFKKTFRKWIRLSFFDVDSVGQLGQMRPKRIATERDIKKIIKFYHQTYSQASGYTIQCWQGISRSAAIALGLLYLKFGSEEQAKVELMKTRPQAMPSRLIVRLFDKELGSNLKTINELIHKEWLEELKLRLRDF